MHDEMELIVPVTPVRDADTRNVPAHRRDRMGTLGVEHMETGAIPWLDTCRARGCVGPCPELCPVATRQHETQRGPGSRVQLTQTRYRRVRVRSAATPRLANARVNSSLNAERREYCCRRSATHFESSASRLVGANARHEATRRAAWP